MATDTKVSSIPSSDRSHAARLVSYVRGEVLARAKDFITTPDNVPEAVNAIRRRQP